MEVRLEKITPDMAREYLKCNTENYRSVQRDRVASYSNDMKNGKWQLNGEGIEFNKAGKLINGQHRLLAIVRAGVPVEMLVIRDVENDVNIYDVGGVRPLGQIAKARGIVTYAWLNVVSAAGWIVNGGATNIRNSGKAIVLQYAEDHAEDLQKAARYSMVGANKPICKRCSIIGAVYCMIRTGHSQTEISEFFRIVNSGIPHGHYESSPPLIYRNMVQEIGARNTEGNRLLFSACIDGVCDFAQGKSRRLRYKFSDKNFELLHQVRMMDGLTEK